MTKKQILKQYYKSRTWRDTSWNYREGQNLKCELCGVKVQKVSDLQTHHITYERLGMESSDDLLALCDDCHVTATKEHRYRNSVCTFARKLWGRCWWLQVTPDYACKEFDKWFEEKR